MDRYNSAIQSVINSTYQDASQVLIDQHNLAIENMHTAIDSLVEATVVLQEVVTVADMAADANTTEEQQQVQQVLQTQDMSIQQEEIDNFNTALVDVETYANQAAGFLAAAVSTDVTTAIDDYAATNNVAVASYASVQYDFATDYVIFDYGSYGGVAVGSILLGNVKSAEEIYDGIGYERP